MAALANSDQDDRKRQDNFFNTIEERLRDVNSFVRAKVLSVFQTLAEYVLLRHDRSGFEGLTVRLLGPRASLCVADRPLSI